MGSPASVAARQAPRDYTPRHLRERILQSRSALEGERKQVSYSMDYNAHWVDEMFEIKVRNGKKEAAEIRVVEHLYRGTNWEIRSPSMQFEKTDAQTIEFRVPLQPDEEKKVTYLVHYTW